MLSSHLKFAHILWEKQLKTPPLGVVVDATLGNGHDLVALAKMINGCAPLVGYDIQTEAIANTQKKIKEELTKEEKTNLLIKNQSHADLIEENIKLIVYNLGYLPGANKAITTQTESTLKSIQLALPRLIEDGLISITCYPGHPEGARELQALKEFAQSLCKKSFCVSFMQWLNRKNAPCLLLIQRNGAPHPS